MEDRELNIEISSTSLGNTRESGGKLGAVDGLGQALFSTDRYTDTILSNTLEAKEITEELIPEANFGISVLSSVVNPEKIKEYISST